MFETLAAMLAEIMNVDVSDISPRTPLVAADGLEELDFARLILAAEKKFSVTIYDVDAAAFYTLEDMRAYLEQIARQDKKGDADEDHSPIDTNDYFYSE